MNMRIFIAVLALVPVSVYGHAEECLDKIAAPGFSCKPLADVNLGAAAGYAVLAGSAITTTIGGSVVGKLGVSPGTSVVGFDDFDGASVASAGQAALSIAYEQAAAAYVGPADRSLEYEMAEFVLSGKDLGGMTLKPGVYKFAVAAALNGRLILDDSVPAPHVWIFQTGSTALFATNSEVIFQTQMLSAGSNSAVDQVTWQIGSSATMMGGAKVIGNVLAYASITTLKDAYVNGRLLAKTGLVSMVESTICSVTSTCGLIAI